MTPYKLLVILVVDTILWLGVVIAWALAMWPTVSP